MAGEEVHLRPPCLQDDLRFDFLGNDSSKHGSLNISYMIVKSAKNPCTKKTVYYVSLYHRLAEIARRREGRSQKSFDWDEIFNS